MPSVSVVLPVYNAESSIERAILSILNQTFTDIELLVVANGSNRETLEKIGVFSDQRLKLINLPNPDIVDALNAGINSAKGEYIARMDADDYSLPNRLEKQLRFLQTSGLDAASCLVKYEGNRENNFGYYLHVKWINSLLNSEEIYNNRFVDSPLAHPTLIAPKALFEKYGYYKSGNHPEDYELILRWLDNGIKIGKVNDTLLHWCDHQSRLSRNHSNYSKEAFYKVKSEYFAAWFKKYRPEKSKVLIWGTGKSVLQKSSYLKDHGIDVAGYIDVRRSRSSDPPVYHYSKFPSNKFILSFVSDRKGREDIYKFLTDKGLEQGKDFYMMA